MTEAETKSPFVGHFELPTFGLASAPDVRAHRLEIAGEAWHIQGLLDAPSTEALLSAAQGASQIPVGLDGILSHYATGDAIGSLRCSAYDKPIAAALWERLHAALPLGALMPRVFSAFDHVDWGGHPFWAPDGVNPLLRFIHYRAGEGELVAHYDAPYIESPERRTLFSFLIYLTDNEGDGATRFLWDRQTGTPFETRCFDDWTRSAQDMEVALTVSPRAGDALVFEHRLLHDGARVNGPDDKWVVRTDLFFSRVPSLAGR